MSNTSNETNETGLGPFDALAAVGRAYAAVFSRVDRLFYFGVIWSAVAALVTVLVPGVIERSLEGRSDFEVPPAGTFAPFGELIVLLAASICMSIAWLRWIVLGEPMDRVLPERTDVAAAYTWRTLVLLLVPLTVGVGILLFTMPFSYGADASWTIDAPMYALTVLLTGAISRALLALPASAVGDRALTFRASWRLTAGHWWPLFVGYLACAVPFNVVGFGLGAFDSGFAEGSLGQAVVDTLALAVGVVGEVVCAAFFAFAYVHFTRGQPSARDPAAYFS